MRIYTLALAFITLLPGLLMAEPIHFMEAHKKTYTVAITQIDDHPVLNDAYQGILQGLKEEGFQENKNLKVIYKNANGDILAAKKIAEAFVKQEVDLIMPISTASAQAVLAADKNAHIPVVFSAITDPVAAGLVPSLTQPGGYVTGVYDFPPVTEQLKVMQALLPQLKTLGVIYNSQEINSTRMLEELKKYLPSSIILIEAHADTANEVLPALQSLIAKKVDAIYVPADNTVVAQMPAVLKITTANRIPVIASEQGSADLGALMALAYDQYEVGYLSGRMAGQILAGKKPGTLDVVIPAHTHLTINKKTAQQLNIQVPEAYQKSLK